MGPGSPLAEDALTVELWPSPAWCNPPYGKGLVRWLDKFLEQAERGVDIVALLPAYTDRLWWKAKVVDPGCDIIFLTGRVPFERPCPECGGIGYYTTEGPGEGGVVDQTCHICSGNQVVVGKQPFNASALVFYGETFARVGWLDWREKANAKVPDHGDPNTSGGGPKQEGSGGEGPASAEVLRP